MNAHEYEELAPPDNFAMVDTGFYRSSFPMKKNFNFLRTLMLKTVLTLVLESYPQAIQDFYEENGINLVQIGIEGNKEPFKDIAEDDVRRLLNVILDPANQPVLLHCNKGKHRTGCIVGCYRKLQGMALSSIFFEYITYAAPKSRLVDQRFIELFEPGPELVQNMRAVQTSRIQQATMRRKPVLNEQKAESTSTATDSRLDSNSSGATSQTTTEQPTPTASSPTSSSNGFHVTVL